MGSLARKVYLAHLEGMVQKATPANPAPVGNAANLAPLAPKANLADPVWTEANMTTQQYCVV